ncbi:ADP-ribosylglycohydrolase family protein [Cohnella sp. CFH 77786]|uniref:ADP-ribosylglycohydrolase family protein n=1 Tax=Cohnella sp. CFH 77786 TaxID=2662265 RepID=UPI00351DA51D
MLVLKRGASEIQEVLRIGGVSVELMNRIKGGLFGVAVGDALGGTTEFMSRREVREKHGYLTDIIGGGVLMRSRRYFRKSSRPHACDWAKVSAMV